MLLRRLLKQPLSQAPPPPNQLATVCSTWERKWGREAPCHTGQPPSLIAGLGFEGGQAGSMQQGRLRPPSPVPSMAKNWARQSCAVVAWCSCQEARLGASLPHSSSPPPKIAGLSLWGRGGGKPDPCSRASLAPPQPFDICCQQLQHETAHPGFWLCRKLGVGE